MRTCDRRWAVKRSLRRKRGRYGQKRGHEEGEREGASRVGTGAAALRYEDSSGPYAKVGALGIRRSVISPAAIICKGEAE